MNILFTLCGRSGSKGFRNKNLKMFLGVPLIYYGIAAIALYCENEAGKQHNVKVVLNTDSNELIDTALNQDSVFIEVINRDAALAGDSVPKVAVIRDCLEKTEDKLKMKFDMVVDLDLTSPIRTLEDVCTAINKKAGRSDVDVVYSVTGSRRNPYFNMVIRDKNYFTKAIVSDLTTRQQAPKFYDMNGSIYVYDVNALKHKKPEIFFNDRCDAFIMKDTGILDIDSEDDYELMQVIAEYLFHSDDNYRKIYETALKL